MTADNSENMDTDDSNALDDEMLERWSSELKSPAFKHGLDVGEGMGAYKAETEAIAAYQAGEIDLWIEFVTPKSMQEWEAFEAQHGNLRNRWSPAVESGDTTENEGEGQHEHGEHGNH